jgi:hypothetical protein
MNDDACSIANGEARHATDVADFDGVVGDDLVAAYYVAADLRLVGINVNAAGAVRDGGLEWIYRVMG